MQKFVCKERETSSFALQEVKQWGIQPKNPTLQSKQPATYKIFTTQLLEGENQIMNKEIINVKLENI